MRVLRGLVVHTRLCPTQRASAPLHSWSTGWLGALLHRTSRYGRTCTEARMRTFCSVCWSGSSALASSSPSSHPVHRYLLVVLFYWTHQHPCSLQHQLDLQPPSEGEPRPPCPNWVSFFPAAASLKQRSYLATPSNRHFLAISIIASL